MSVDKHQPSNQCNVQGSFNKVFMTGNDSSISVNIHEDDKQQSNRDSGYDEEISSMNSSDNDHDIIDVSANDNEQLVPMETDNAVTSCIVKGSENMVIMTGDNSSIKVNTNSSKDVAGHEKNGNHGNNNFNNNNVNSSLSVQEDCLSSVTTPQEIKELSSDGVDIGERPVAHVRPFQKENEQQVLSNAENPISHHSITGEARNSYPVDLKRRTKEENKESNKRQKLNHMNSQGCDRNSCETSQRVTIEGDNNTAITAMSGSTINLTYCQCKHSQEISKKNTLNIDHIDGEALEKIGMMNFFKRVSKHIGSTSNKWKQLARELPMVTYEHLEREIRLLEQAHGTNEQKALNVLVKWWKCNPVDTSMKRTLVYALRHIKLQWLASSLEKEIA